MNEPAQRSISVTGTGDAEGVPDTAIVHVGVSVLASSMKEASDRANEAMKRVLDAARANGVAETDLRTEVFRSHAEYDHSGRTRRIQGYRVTNAVRVRIHPVDATPGLLESVTAAGADAVTIDGIGFEMDDTATLEQRARAAAWTDALHKARQLAALAGVGLGPVRAIDEITGRQAHPVMLESSVLMADGGGPQIEAGSHRVEITLNVIYEIA